MTTDYIADARDFLAMAWPCSNRKMARDDTDPDQLSPTELATAERKIRRAIQELKDAGVVTLASSSSRGRTAVYRIHPHPGEPVDNSPDLDDATDKRRSPSALHSGHPAPSISDERRALSAHNGGRSAPSRGEHRGEQERRGPIQDPTQPSAQLSRPAR